MPIDSYTNPGQSWNADDQCKMIYGNSSSFCRVKRLLQIKILLNFSDVKIFNIFKNHFLDFKQSNV
jgi:hypothetical protein